MRAHGLRAPPDDQADLARICTTTATAGATQDETVRTTANHPWLTTDRGWVLAGDLRSGEQIVREGGAAPATVTALRVVAGAADYYNLTVSVLHTYAVGDSAYVVHNCSVDDAEQLRQGFVKPNGENPGAGAIISQDGSVPLTGYAGETGVENPGFDITSHPHGAGCAEVICAYKAVRSMEMGTGGWQKGKPMTLVLSQRAGLPPCPGCESVLHQLATYADAPITVIYQSETMGPLTFPIRPGIIPFGGSR